ncbi:S66 peptidase family protein [Streptomonospora salina]|uniref:Muramoyltetrapeptide carboxypeptidase n=1 Tax=Streptomonospora salina TaxID=104205 RepID=A0A841E6U9_9ACTN|nr:LD-carboxypeptidase [Streptomonospora salina]MBB5996888.1 muramoyltetrapeptide carboxypeptidase [Streptomonospora salina]
MTQGPGRRGRRLRPGDAVSVVAPCSPVPADMLEAGLAVLHGWGLEAVAGAHLRGRHPRLPYLAGTDAERAADLQRALADPRTSAVLCARGGDGAHRVLDGLDFGELRRAPVKPLVGFSDVTALHEAVAVELGAAGLHGPVVALESFAEDPVAAEHLRTTLFAPEEAAVLSVPGAETLVGGVARGVTAGGNLSVLNDSLAAPHSRRSARGAIVLLEDVAEDVSRIDRMLTRMLRSGWLDGAAGLVLGSWERCTPDASAVRTLLLERLAPLGVPVVGEFGFGHRAAQLTVPLGAAATLDADACTLVLDRPALV